MKLTPLFSTTLVASTALVLTGTINKQPLLRTIGEITALGVISQKIIKKQQKINVKNQ